MNKEQKKILASKDPKLAYEYAKDVIKGRWPEAEETISEDPWWACIYAKNVIDGRFSEAEETISKDPEYAYEYVTEVINGQRSAILESIYLCNTSHCDLSTVKDYLSRIDWADPANDFPIPKRLKYALKTL